MQRIILASQSPRRKQILEQLGLTFEVIPSEYEEDMSIKLAPEELAKILSAGKAQDISNKYPDALVIAADTFIVHNGELIGKPHTTERAIEVLTALGGTTHQVLSGVTIMNSEKKVTQVAVTNVTFRKLTDEMIKRYIEKEEILEIAAGYKIQSLGASLIDHIEGDYFNVVGLPVSNLVNILEEFGIQIP